MKISLRYNKLVVLIKARENKSNIRFHYLSREWRSRKKRKEKKRKKIVTIMTNSSAITLKEVDQLEPLFFFSVFLFI